MTIPTETHPLCGLLACHCGQWCFPTETANETRAYGSVCGCRTLPLDANIIERLVFNAAEREAPTLLAHVPVDDCWPIVRQIFAKVVVATAADDLSFVRVT